MLHKEPQEPIVLLAVKVAHTGTLRERSKFAAQNS
jgi:hypothetical protein